MAIGPECLLKLLKREHLFLLYFSIFLSFPPLIGSKVNKVDFSKPATGSWIRASSNSSCACRAHPCSVVLQTPAIYSAMNLNEGNAVKPSCFRCWDGISRSTCQLIKSTYSFQLCGFIPIIISLSLNLEIKAFGPRRILYPPPKTFIYFNPLRWFATAI